MAIHEDQLLEALRHQQAAMISGQNVVIGDSGSCMAGPCMFKPIGHVLLRFNGEWQNTFFSQQLEQR